MICSKFHDAYIAPVADFPWASCPGSGKGYGANSSLLVMRKDTDQNTSTWKGLEQTWIYRIQLTSLQKPDGINMN